MAVDYSAFETIWMNGSRSAETPATLETADDSAITLGTIVVFNQTGYWIHGVAYYKGSSAMSGTKTINLWEDGGAKLAEATVDETGFTVPGWHYALFDTPFEAATAFPYVVSVHAPAARYASSSAYFSGSDIPADSGDWSADETGVLNAGIYSYGASPTRPGSAFNNSFYWVDALVYNSATAPQLASGGTSDFGVYTYDPTWDKYYKKRKEELETEIRRNS